MSLSWVVTVAAAEVVVARSVVVVDDSWWVVLEVQPVTRMRRQAAAQLKIEVRTEYSIDDGQARPVGGNV